MWTLGWFYLSVLQATLFLRSKICVVTPYGKYSWGGVPPLGGETDHGATSPATVIWELELPTSEGRDYGGVSGGTGYLNFQEVEHNGPVYCDSDHSGSLSEGR